MARPNPGDDSNPRSGEGGPRHTPAVLAADPAFTGTYARKDRDGQVRRMVNPGTDLYQPWAQGSSTSISLTAPNLARIQRFVPARDCVIYGLIGNIITSSGNIDVGIFDESLVRLASTGSMACPSANKQYPFHFPAGGVALTAGKTYWLAIACDNTTAAFGGWNADLIGSHMISGQIGSVVPMPARFNGFAARFNANMTNGVTLVPMLSPALTAFPPAPYVPASNTPDNVFCQDPQTGRIFAGRGTAMYYSDDQGTSWTLGFFTGVTPEAMVITADRSLLIGGPTATANVGTLLRGPVDGPYNLTTYTAVISNQEGNSRQWNLVAYSDGLCFAGNYFAAGTTGVKIRKSTDHGATWTTVMDLGIGDGTNLKHVHSVIRDPNTATTIWANIGDAGASAGLYKSTDSGANWTRQSAFDSIRLTPVVSTPDGLLWASDQYKRGGNLWLLSPDGTTLQPRSFMDTPWTGDCYAMTKDSNGIIWYASWYTNDNLNRQAVYASPDNGVTSFLVADLGATTSAAVALLRVGNYLFYGSRRYTVGGLPLT